MVHLYPIGAITAITSTYGKASTNGTVPQFIWWGLGIAVVLIIVAVILDEYIKRKN